MLLGFILSIKKESFKFVCSLLTGLIVTCYLFFRIQDMGEQHYYILCFAVACLISLGFINLIDIAINKQNKYFTILFKIIAVILVLTNFLMSIGIGVKYKNSLWMNKTYTPKIRYDIDVLNELENYLGELETKGYHNVYCLGSNGTICDDVLTKLNAPDFNLPFYCVRVPCIDLRDGFSTNFFDSDIILVCDPVQYHLQQGQELIKKLNEIMLKKNNFSKKYEVINTFILDNNVKVLVYMKKEQLDKSDITYIEDIYKNIYADHHELFTDRIENYIKKQCY